MRKQGEAQAAFHGNSRSVGSVLGIFPANDKTALRASRLSENRWRTRTIPSVPCVNLILLL